MDGLRAQLVRVRLVHDAFFMGRGGRLMRLFVFVDAKDQIAPKLNLWRLVRHFVRTLLPLRLLIFGTRGSRYVYVQTAKSDGFA